MPVDIFVDERNVRFGLRNVSSFRTEGSASNPGLQAADLLASTVARLVREVHFTKPWTPEMQRLALSTLPALMEDDPLFAGALAHRDTLGKMLLPMFKRLST